MKAGEPEPEDVSVEEDWTAIGEDDELWAAPTTLPPPLAAPAPPLLNTHEMEWPAFENLIMGMARRLDGAFEARRYGKPGQAQHGLDVVAFFAERKPSVYQAKRWKKFGAADLEAAVKRYGTGHRPFGADRLVIAVASEVRATKTIEKLAKLREDHPHLMIELWDRAQISERLRNQPQLVTTFFSAATAAAFCVSGPPPAPQSAPTSIEADAILRGPIAHLGLIDDVRMAEQALADRPDEAAALLATAAERLESEGFVPHAAPVREMQARALGAAGRRVEEGFVRITLGWRRLAAGDTPSVRAQLDVLRKWGADIPAQVARGGNALAAVTGLRSDHGVTLDQVAAAVDALVEGDPHHAVAVLALAEGAVVARQPGVVQARAELIERLAGAMSADDEGQLIAARLRMCVADCCGGWEGLAASARDTYPPAVAALVIARSARHLTLVPSPQAAVARWRDAIERACMAQLNDDAADWLYALRAVRIENSLLGPDINDLHRHAQALRSAGNGTILPEAYSAHERGLNDLRDQKWPDAFEELQRYLWRAVVGASWVDELEAHELLGDLFAQTGRGFEAVQHYIAAGSGTKLEAFAEVLREQAVGFPIELLTRRPWERTAAFEFATKCSELIVDDDARKWCSAAFQEIKEHPQPAAFGSPDPWLAAFAAFGQLAELSSKNDAREFLAISKELLPRGPGKYRRSDEAQVFALIGIARAHVDLRTEALDQLLQAVLFDQRMAERALQHGGDLLRSDPDRVAAAISEAANENLYAALALVISGADTAPLVPLAARRLEAAIAPRVHQPGQMTFGTGLSQTAGLVTALPEDDRLRFAKGMLDFARDEQESSHNRYDALAALRAIACHLPAAVRSELFDAVLPFALGEADGAESDELFPGASDLLRRFTVHIGNSPLAGAGVMAAATLAGSDVQYAAVERVAVKLLSGADELMFNSIAAALVALPIDKVTLPVGVLAAHPSPWLRALAAVLWVKRPNEPEEIGVRLARDASRHVRDSLAGGLSSEARHASVREILEQDPRRSVRHRVCAGGDGANSTTS